MTAITTAREVVMVDEFPASEAKLFSPILAN